MCVLFVFVIGLNTYVLNLRMSHNYNLLYIISKGSIIYTKFFKCIIYRTARKYEHLGRD